MGTVRRRVRARAYRSATFAVSVRWILLSLLLAGVGILETLVVVPFWISAALAAVSVLLVVVDVLDHRRRQRRTQFTPRSTDSFSDVRKALATSPRFRLIDFSGGTFLYDRVGSEVFADPTVTVRLQPAEYVVPIEFRDLGRLFQRRHVRGYAHAYNDPVVGLDTNLGYGADDCPSSINLLASRYWDYLSSDLFAAHEVVVDGHPRTDLGRRLVIDRDGRPRDFADSWLLNAVGVSVLAVTSDGRYVVVTQSDKNDSAKGEFAPTGSGSLEPKDFRGATEMPIGQLCAHGALREATEEAAIRETEVASVHPLGFGRWMQKSAEPEVLLLAFLTIDSHEVRRREVPRTDRPFTLTFEPERFVAPPSAWVALDLSTMVDNRICDAMSVPLGACLMLLAENIASGASAIATELTTRVRS